MKKGTPELSPVSKVLAKVSAELKPRDGRREPDELPQVDIGACKAPLPVIEI